MRHQYLIHTPSPTPEQSHGATGQLEMLQALVLRSPTNSPHLHHRHRRTHSLALNNFRRSPTTTGGLAPVN
ncbi:hypothetical protein [Leptolyngbya subtilissima]|uniref:hypothetical protein n=1 Tax=Leptolyngbya subtilissima TaxID=1346803 RepID=UPI003297B166